jgi:hypothetical protein
MPKHTRPQGSEHDRHPEPILVASKIWAHARAEGWSDEATLLALYLLTCRHRSGACEEAYQLPEDAAADLDWSRERLAKVAARLESAGLITYEPHSSTVTLTGLLRYQRPCRSPQQGGR